MRELMSRLHAAWRALRGGSVLRDVKITGGVVEMPGDVSYYGDSRLSGCDIRVPAPVVVRVGPRAAFDGNTGDGIGRVDRPEE